MPYLKEQIAAALTYLFSALTCLLKFLNDYAAGISALVAIIMLCVTIWFKREHLKIARAHGHNHDKEGHTSLEEDE